MGETKQRKEYCEHLVPFARWKLRCRTRPVARGGGSGGRTTPPVAHPKDFVPPFSNFVPPFSNFVPPFSNFVPPFSNFVPPLEYVDDVTRTMSKGGCL